MKFKTTCVCIQRVFYLHVDSRVLIERVDFLRGNVNERTLKLSIIINTNLVNSYDNRINNTYNGLISDCISLIRCFGKYGIFIVYIDYINSNCCV